MEWQPIETIEYPIVDADPIPGIPNARPMLLSRKCLLWNGREIWLGDDCKIGDTRIKWGRELATHWIPLPEPPKESTDE